ncbi:alpha/beta fold hydrolase [Pedobacter arcticus]|uniref:alpha/beta fold hydrolase n=1 Tax=Pedobacter arcticus TaxID=752140 RepID=UPI0002E7B767|nr:alpha/beta hydrolase [Pedobacter arcticus]
MTNHYFENKLVKMHYYQFGNGPKAMLCFHGYGMHGKQFRQLEERFGANYTFYGFDLFFHKETKLLDESVANVKQGITKKELTQLFLDFCKSKSIDKFSILAYSMGSFYACTLAEEVAEKINEFIVAAPASLKPGRIITFFSKNTIGNKLLEHLALSNNGMTNLLATLKRVKVIDAKAHEILYREIATPELRFSFFACATYLRFLKLDIQKFTEELNQHNVKSIFIFGKRDHSYPAKIGDNIISKITNAQQLEIDENHDMINQNFAQTLATLLNDH